MKNRYQVSEAFKQSCKENIGLNRYGRIHVVEDNLDIEGEQYGGQLVDFTIEDNCYVDDTFIGTTVAKKITVNILNPDNSINLEDKTIEVYVGIKINGEIEEIPYGTYIIEKPEDKEVQKKTSFIGYDYMIKFNPTYQDRVKYPIKLSALLEDLCDQVGLKLGSTDFINNNYMVLGNPFTDNEDCRTVLSNIAQLAGGFAKIGRDNKVYIRTLKKAPTGMLKVKDVHNMPVQDLHNISVKMLSSYRDSANESLDANNYFDDFAKNNQWGEVNSLVLALSNIEGENTARTDEANIKKNGLTEIVIEDNYFLINEEERNKVIDNLWTNLKGIYYLPFKSKYYGYPHLDSGDMLAVDDIKGIQFVSYVLNHTFTFNGAFDGELNIPAMTKTQVAYKNTQDVKSRFKRVERSVDKINGEIEDIIEFEDQTTQQFSQHKQTIDSIQDTVSNVQKDLKDNYYTITETNSQITQKADSITSEVNKSITTAKQEAINSANSSTDNKLKSYTKTVDMNSKIEQTAENITSTVSASIKETKKEITSETDKKLAEYSTTTEMESKIEQSAKSIESTVTQSIKDDINKNYSTTTEMESKIKQTAENINTEVRKKVNSDEVVSTINQSAEAIELKAGRLQIISGNFLLSENGLVKAKSGIHLYTAGGGLEIIGEEGHPPYIDLKDNENDDFDGRLMFEDNQIQIMGGSGVNDVLLVKKSGGQMNLKCYDITCQSVTIGR